MAEITVSWLQEVLARHDPLGAWSSATASSQNDYRSEAELAALGLRHLQGLGHAKTVVADALDRVHPGLYQALVDGDPELGQRLNRVAREIWERRGALPAASGSRAVPGPTATVQPPPAPPAELVADPDLLTTWLREVEDVLTDLVSGSVDPRNARPFHDALPALLDAYAAATDEQRAATRVSFSRFRLVRYHLSAFAAAQYRDVNGPNPRDAVWMALMAEALLDGGIDWRDELLVLRDLRKAALGAGVAFESLLEQAVRCSGLQSRRLLQSLHPDG